MKKEKFLSYETGLELNNFFWVGLFAVVVGGVLLYFGAKVSGNTSGSKFSGSFGAAAVILGVVLMAIGVS